MGWVCPECGVINKGEVQACGCGFQSVFLISEPAEDVLEREEISDNDVFDNALSMQDIFPEDGSDPTSPEKISTKKLPAKRKEGFSKEERIIKEIGAWRFSFSPSDGRISMKTPALDPFCLKMTIEEMQEILDTAYELTGAGKTLRSLEMGEKDVCELIDLVGEMIDVKKSKIRPAFSPGELGEVKAFINQKLSRR